MPSRPQLIRQSRAVRPKASPTSTVLLTHCGLHNSLFYAVDMARRSPIVIPPPISSATPATVFFIHGYNDLASQFNCSPPNQLSVAYHLHKSPLLQHMKVVIPEALPCIHRSIPNNVWYNIGTAVPEPGDPERAYESVEVGVSGRNEDDMNVTMDYFESLIKLEIATGTPAKRIVFVGYSQGATILTLFLLTRRLAAELGAVISYAGFPPTPMQSISRMQDENGLIDGWSKETKLFMLHGAQDAFVPFVVFQEWLKRIEGFRDRGRGIASLEWRLIDGMRHSMSAILWPYVREILEKVVLLTESKPPFKL
jgi:predicted esterase